MSGEYHEYLRSNAFNNDLFITTQYNKKLKVRFFDQTASGFPLKDVEKYLETSIYPYYTNTHSNNFFGRLMSFKIKEAKNIIRDFVNGNPKTDKVIFDGAGTSGVVNHLAHLIMPRLQKSTVIVSDMEHYSNYLPWYHHAANCVVINSNDEGKVDVAEFQRQIKKLRGSPFIVSMTSASNVTGVLQNVYLLAQITHHYGGLIFVDYAASMPYIPVDMHYDNQKGIYFDAIFFSPHKMPGGQSSPGVLIWNSDITCNPLSFTPGGGTVRFVCKKEGPVYSNDIEVKESGGTPNIIGICRLSRVFEIQKKYVNMIQNTELQTTQYFQEKLLQLQSKYPERLKILNPIKNTFRLPIFAIQIVPFHYNYIVALLSDMFGIMTRGGVSCSGVLAERLLQLTERQIMTVKKSIESNHGVPWFYGWIRITLHSVHTIEDISYLLNALDYICQNAEKHINDYIFDEKTNLYNATKAS